MGEVTGRRVQRGQTVRPIRAVVLAVVAAVLLLGAVTSGRAEDANLGAFWIRFRTAMLEDDRDAVVASSQVPFELRSAGEDMPSLPLDAAGLREALPDLMLADSGLSAEPEAMLDLLERQEEPPAESEPGSELRLGAFVFVRADDGWHFAAAYVER